MKYFCVLILTVFDIDVIHSASGQHELLDKRLLYYEPLLYDSDDLHLRHTQVGESRIKLLRLKFYAYNRKDSSSQNIILQHKKKTTTQDLSFIYTGKDTDYPGSEARLAVINGTVQGKVRLPGDAIYHIAPSSWLFKTLPHFHTVIYSEKDYVWNHTYHSDTSRLYGSQSQNMYHKPRGRRKRALTPPSRVEDPHVCTVKLTTDKTVWQYFMNLDQNEDRSRYDILFMLENHVTETNNVFKNTEFTLKKSKNKEEKLKGIQFEIRKIKIMTDIDCDDEVKPSALCNEDLDGQSLLYEFSDEDHNIDYDYDNPPQAGDNGIGDDAYYEYPEVEAEYCLSFLITARVLYANKESPLLGLAFHADDFGGICSIQNNGFITLFQGTKQALPALVTQLVFAHEIAHGFGAIHDNMEECSKFNLKEEPADGFYLMHKVAQRGDKPNHYKLSPCSLKYISKALSQKEPQTCFTGSKLPYCGNGIVDDGEECDCGEDCYTGKDNCCHSYNETGGLRCTLKTGAQCSPSQGPCCDSNVCQFINRSENLVCQNAKPCVDELYCHGEIYGAQCPPPDNSQQREDGFICSGNGRVCDAGSCNASICKLIQWRECQMSNDNRKLSIQDKEDLCYIGCRRRRSDECISSHDTYKVKQHPEFMYLLSNISSNATMLPVQLPPGTPCNKNKGYCDVFNRCRGANPDTPLARLKNCFTSGACAEHILYILRVYNGAVIVCFICVVILLYLFAKCCAVHTKSSNPEVELRHPHRSVRQSVTSVRDSVLHPKQTFRGSVRSVRGSLRSVRGSMRNAQDSLKRMSGRPVACELDLKKIEEELQVLNKTPPPNTDANEDDIEVLNKAPSHNTDKNDLEVQYR